MAHSCEVLCPSSSSVRLVHLTQTGVCPARLGTRSGSAGTRMSSALRTRARHSLWCARSRPMYTCPMIFSGLSNALRKRAMNT